MYKIYNSENIHLKETQSLSLTKTSSSDTIFDQFMTVPANQQQFLTNIHNKSCFISMLSDKLITKNLAVKQAQNDDVLIIETAIEQFNATNTIVVVGEDVDLLIKSIYHKKIKLS